MPTFKFSCIAIILALSLPRSMSAQDDHRSAFAIREANLGFTFDFDRTQLAQAGTPAVWLKGGSADASLTFAKGFGLAIAVSGGHASNIAPGVSFSEIDYLAGPRLTLNAAPYLKAGSHHSRPEIYVQSLFGYAHAFDSVFPAAGNVVSSTAALAIHTGGGIDIPLKQGFDLRALDISWVHTNLPNNAANSQNNLLIGFGLSFRR